MKEKKYILHTGMLTAIFFSGSAFFSETNNKYYIAIIIIICICSFFYGLSKKNLFKKVLLCSYTWWVLFLFIFYMLYGLLLPRYRGFNVDIFIFIPIVVLNVIVWFISIPIKKAIIILIRSIAISSILLIGYIVTNEIDIIMMGTERIGTSASGNVNNVGLYFGVYSIFVLYRYLYENKKKYLLLYLVIIPFMLLTGSKKAIIFIIIGHGLLLMLKEKTNVKKYLLPLSLLGILLYVVLTNEIFFNIIGIRVLGFLKEFGFDLPGVDASVSTFERRSMISIGWEAFLQKPLFGNGWQYYSYYSGMNMYSHNNYIELLVNYGVFGFLLSYSMYFYLLKKLFKRIGKNSNFKLFFTFIFVIMVVDFASITFYESPRNYIILFFGFLLVKSRNEASSSIE
jgi:O-antigen ligase